MKQGTAKVLCTCENNFQDKTYGKNVRVANTTTRQPDISHIYVRCTVCSKEHSVFLSKVNGAV